MSGDTVVTILTPLLKPKALISIPTVGAVTTPWVDFVPVVPSTIVMLPVGLALTCIQICLALPVYTCVVVAVVMFAIVILSP